MVTDDALDYFEDKRRELAELEREMAQLDDNSHATHGNDG